MALAALCSGLLRDNSRTIAAVVPNLGFQAFVVDHGVRRGSDTEAYSVSKVLESRGM
jgi:tRNA(Ile)-lysidine synthase